ncbi:MAG: ABC transporter substrate-binding protein, partial [Methyloversatilis sp. 12-65-5]
MSSSLTRERLLQAYRTMRTIREFEERVHVDFATGEIPGFVHLYAGEEASATGICMHLNRDDYIASTHRGHGHCIAKGVDPVGMMAEIWGKRTGTCKGKARLCQLHLHLLRHRGGHPMHIADLEVGMLGANGIVGGGGPLICGTALASKLRGSNNVGVCFFGDGASNQGTIFEAMNLAAVWKLPVIFVGENNGYAEATASKFSVACENIADRASAFGMPGVITDGFDFFAVHEAAGEAVKRAREGGGPTLLEVKLSRYYGHFEGDQQTYRAPGEVQKLRDTKDCLMQFARRVTSRGELSMAELEAIDVEVNKVYPD